MSAALSSPMLPPPYSYEELYSSYQNEWDQQRKQTTDSSDAWINDTNEFESLSHLHWATVPNEDGDTSYLLGCTESGFLLVWKLGESTKASGDSKGLPNLVFSSKQKIMQEGLDHSEDGSRNSVWNELCILSVPTPHDAASAQSVKGRKRQRQEHDTPKRGLQHIVLVAGSHGLWSISLNDLLKESNSWRCWSDRPIVTIQPLSCHGKPESLFGLEQDTNALLVWDVGTILLQHSNDKIQCQEVQLSLYFSLVKDRKLQGPSDEVCTSLLVSAYQGKPCLLVGTDQANVWVLSMNTSESKIRIEETLLGLTVAEDGSLQSNGHASNSQSRNRRRKRRDAWKITDMVQSEDGTWWTASASSTSTAKQKSSTSTTGIIVTWHSLTGMVVARQETREAIHCIRNETSGSLVSVGNEEAVSVWESPWSLNHRERFWTSPRSCKTIALHSNLMAIAGVGREVDLFVDRCKVQTLRF